MGDRRDGHRRAGYDKGGGYKRRREEDDVGQAPPRGPDAILAALIKLCKKKTTDGEDPLEPHLQIEGALRLMTREVRNSEAQLIRILLDCAVEMAHKTPVYAALVGLLNTEEPEFVGKLLQKAQEELQSALDTGDRARTRLLLRFLAALVPCNVVHASSVLKQLHAFVEAAIEVADRGGSGQDEQRTWQPYADFLVYCSLMALPWGGGVLASDAPAGDLDAMLADVQRYLDLRPAAETPALRPFLRGEDAACQSDSGAASFLGQLWEATQQLREGDWEVAAIPDYNHDSNEAVLARATQHDLGPLNVPRVPPCLAGTSLPAIEGGAIVLAAYPPRGGIKLLPPENTWADKPKIERLIAEEYILDTIHFYDGDRVECAKTLALELPLEGLGKLEPVLTEVIFSQMMRLPSPHLKPIAYATILADICRLLAPVPRSMSACVREFFQRMSVLDPHLRSQLAEWLAYHLSNFDFMWPWAKWSYVLQAPPHDAQRRFVVDVFSKLIRLSYYGNIKGKVPEIYMQIFPPKPEAQPLEEEDATAVSATENGDSEEVAAPAAVRTTSLASPAEKKWAKEFIGIVRAKKVPEEATEAAQQWVADQGVEGEVGGRLGVLRVVLRGIMMAGAKSFTHMLIALERLDDLLTRMVAELGEQGQVALVETAADVWRNAPQRAAQAIDRLMAHRLVEGSAILRWAFASPGLLSLEDQIANGLAWEAVYNAVNKTLARTQDAKEELEAAKGTSSAAPGLTPPKPTSAPASAAPAADGDKPEDGVKAEADVVTLAVVDDREVARQQELREREREVAEAVKTQDALLLLCFELFRDVLSGEVQPSAENGVATAVAEAKEEWRRYTEAQLMAFTRRYHAAAANLAGTLEDGIFGADKVESALRQSFMDSLHI